MGTAGLFLVQNNPDFCDKTYHETLTQFSPFAQGKSTQRFCVLQANDSFSMVYSGGRDRKVWSFDLRNPDNRSLICEEKAPVLKVCGSISL